MLLSELSVYGGTKNINVMIEDLDYEALVLLIKYTDKKSLKVFLEAIPEGNCELIRLVKERINT